MLCVCKCLKNYPYYICLDFNDNNGAPYLYDENFLHTVSLRSHKRIVEKQSGPSARINIADHDEPLYLIISSYSR